MTHLNSRPDAECPPVSVAAMVSGQGRGSNLAALMEGCRAGNIGARMSVVIGTRADAPALDRARDAGVPVTVISPRKYEESDSDYGEAILRALHRNKVDLVCLAGYMRKLPLSVVTEYRNRIMNIHPALLPFFGGQGMYGERVHQAVLESGMKVSGCTVHFVDEEYDSGPIIVQAAVPVLDDDDALALGHRVLEAEHRAYVEAVRLFAQSSLRVEGRRVRVSPRGESGANL